MFIIKSRYQQFMKKKKKTKNYPHSRNRLFCSASQSTLLAISIISLCVYYVYVVHFIYLLLSSRAYEQFNHIQSLQSRPDKQKQHHSFNRHYRSVKCTVCSAQCFNNPAICIVICVCYIYWFISSIVENDCTKFG